MIVSMIFIHEYGHFYAMKLCKMKTKGIYLIPFFGGAAVADEDFKSRYDEAFIAMMGPWFGLACSVATGSLYYVAGNPIFAAGGAWMATINLINLLPVNPLDGGRVLKSLTFSIHNKLGILFLGIGILGMIGLALILKSPIFAILLFFAGVDLYLEYKKIYTKEELNKEYFKIVDKYDKTMSQFRESNNMQLSEEFIEQVRNESYEKIKKMIYSDNIFLQEKPKMTSKQIISYFFFYIATAMVFVLTIYLFKHIPGVDVAIESLK